MLQKSFTCFLWNAVFFPQLLYISILLSLSNLSYVIPWTFYIAIFFLCRVTPLWNPWLSLNTPQKITPDCWQVASTWPVHCCQDQAVNVLLHVNCCFLCNSCCSSGMCVCSVCGSSSVCVCVCACINLGCKTAFSWAKYSLICVYQK